jgi:hypothetical protein
MQTDDRQGQVLTGRHRGKRGRRYLRVTAERQGDAGETRAQRIAALFARQVCHFDEAAYRANLIPDSHDNNNRRNTMHYHLEIVMPPTDDVSARVAGILTPFCECGTDENGEANTHTFWDWYEIGGRWSGEKVLSAVDPDQLKEFWARLIDMKFTVSAVVCGKEELSPPSQISAVDALWCSMFPHSPVKVCPLFHHFGKAITLDTCRLDQVNVGLSAERVIIADQSRAKHMFQTSVWNGVCSVDSTWNGNVCEAVASYREKLKEYSKPWRVEHTPMDNWLAVTVDYHS